MKLRHEWKIEIDPMDLMVLRQRLGAVARPDPHAPTGRYRVRSLYFDNRQDKALLEKINGVDHSEKFRIRLYNCDSTVIHLEKKIKRNGLCSKQTADLTAAEAQSIVDGQWEWMIASDRPLVRELYTKMQLQGLRPRTIVDYTREPFVYGPGHVRVTLDYNIRTGLRCTDFLNPHCITVPAGDPVILLEVKWDEYLPDVIRDAVQMKGRRVGAYSKYAACRTHC